MDVTSVPVIHGCHIGTQDSSNRSRKRKTHHSFQDLAEHNVSAVQPFGFLRGDKELRTVRVFASVSHRHPARAVVLQFEVLVVKTVPINTLA